MADLPDYPVEASAIFEIFIPSQTDEFMVETVELSIVIPVFNEEPVLKDFYERLKRICDNFGKPYELVFIDDGSSDRSFPILSKGFGQVSVKG